MKKSVLLLALLMVMSVPASFGEVSQPAKTDAVVTLYETASRCFENEKYTETIRLCDKALSLDSKNERVYILKILALYSKNKINERNKIVAQALKLFPESPVINFYQGCVYYENKDYDNAIKYLKKSIDIVPTQQAYHVLGLSYGELKQHKLAYEYLKKEVELTPVDENREILAEASKLLKQENYRKAYDLADEVSKTESLYYASYKIKAIASANMYEYTKALKNINKAIELHDDEYPITLYGIRESIYYQSAYLNGEKTNLKYAKKFKKDFDLIAENYAYQLYPNDEEYGERKDTMMTYLDYLVNYILKSESYASQKINTLLDMMTSYEIQKSKYSNMYYYKLYAIALKLALDVSDRDFRQTNTSRKKVLELIKQRTAQEGDRYQDDFYDYLTYRLSDDEKKADTLIRYMVVKRDKMHAYPKGALYEDDIDEILDYVKKYQELIWNYHE